MIHLNMARVALIAVLAIVPALLAGTLRAADAPVAGKTGEQRLTFKERSPLTSLKALAQRLGEKKLEPDYDLSQQEFLVWVPDDYTPEKPPGILLLMNYKSSGEMPEEATLAMLKEKRLIFVMPTQSSDTWMRVGWGLDAIHNLKKLHKIDDSRIYCFSFYDQSAQNAGEGHRADVGERLSIWFPDVITGCYHNGMLNAWQPIKVPGKGTYPPSAQTPPAAQLALARTHPMVVSPNGEDADYVKLMDRFGQQQFRLYKNIPVTKEDIHYPHYAMKWFQETIEYLDTNVPKPKPKAGPATLPAAPPGANSTPVQPAPKPAGR